MDEVRRRGIRAGPTGRWLPVPALALALLLAAQGCRHAPLPDAPPAPDTHDAAATVPAAALRELAPDRGARPYRVAVIDVFYPGDSAFPSVDERRRALLRNDAFDIDGDRRRDPWYHGDVVALYLAAPGLEVVPCPIDDLTDPKREILRRLREVEWRALAGEPIDAVLLAWESSTLRSSFGADLRVVEAEAYKRLVRSWGEDSVSWRTTAEIIDELEHLAACGLAVFTIAGNSGRGAVNAYSFAEGVRTVGGEEPDDEGLWISSNAFVDEVAQAAYRVRLVRGIDGAPIGYDVNEDGEPDVPLDRVSGAPSRGGGSILKGSSFAAPAALRRHYVLQRTALGHPLADVSIR